MIIYEKEIRKKIEKKKHEEYLERHSIKQTVKGEKNVYS